MSTQSTRGSSVVIATLIPERGMSLTLRKVKNRFTVSCGSANPSLSPLSMRRTLLTTMRAAYTAA